MNIWKRYSMRVSKNWVKFNKMFTLSPWRGIWQRHYWEHLIRDERDYRRHMDYIHINPLKHGHVSRVADWPYSTFHRYVASGIYPPDWCGSVDGPLGGLE